VIGAALPLALLGISVDVQGEIERYGYWAVFLIVFMETAGIPLPGEITLLLAGVAAGAGHLELPILIVLSTTGAILGDNVGYAIGRFGGRRVVLRMAHFGHVSAALGWGEAFFAQHGGKTVFLARWTAGLRIFGAWIAGMTHMPWRTFFLWNAIGGFTWATAMLLLGYIFSGSVKAIESWLGTGGAIIFGVAAAALLIYLLRRISHRRAAAEPEPGD
jgi:membrane protein DedA with SNARE-associated domain